MIQEFALSSSARHSAWYRTGDCRFMLDILNGKKTALSSSARSCTSYRSGICRVQHEILHGRAEGPVEFCLKLYMVHNWFLPSSARHSTWYRSGRCRILLDILKVIEILLDLLRGTEVGATEFCSTFYVVWKWTM